MISVTHGIRDILTNMRESSMGAFETHRESQKTSLWVRSGEYKWPLHLETTKKKLKNNLKMREVDISKHLVRIVHGILLTIFFSFMFTK